MNIKIKNIFRIILLNIISKNVDSKGELQSWVNSSIKIFNNHFLKNVKDFVDSKSMLKVLLHKSVGVFKIPYKMANIS